MLFFGIAFLNPNTFFAQQSWSKQKKIGYFLQKKEIYQNKRLPDNYEILSLNKEVFEARLKSSKENFIKLPNATGNLIKFKVTKSSNFNHLLQAKYPNIKSYTAYCIDDPTITASMSMGSDGFHAAIYSKKETTVYIDPFTKNQKDYIVYKKEHLQNIDQDFKCLTEDYNIKEFSETQLNKANDGKLRTYKMALSCTGEYAQFHLGSNQQNIPNSASEQVKKAAVLSAMNTTMTRINGVFTRELSIKLELVSNNDEIIFLDPNTDGLSDNNSNALLNENQSICDATIGRTNYDIGHVLSTGGGSLDGVAVLGSACINGQKAKGATGLGTPVGDAYDVDLVIHELGHQFGATHTQNNDCNRTDETAVEPGSGSTIMGYSGICSPNVFGTSAGGNSDDYFHAVSIAQIINILETSASCATLTDTNNSAPNANAGNDFSIPKSTPFKLTGTGTDVDGINSLTYNWEQLDNETLGKMPPESTNKVGPLFRSFPPKTTPTRYFPDLATVVAGNTATVWEVLPSVERALNFAFTVRDNNPSGGNTARDDMKIDVIDTTPFTVTSPNTSVSWDTGSAQTITWNKGQTDAPPIECSLVNIKLSEDGGVTFPITLKSNTPNDGSEEIIIPDNATTTARIMVEAADNIFYNVNSTNFTIRSTVPTFVIKNTNGVQTVCNSGNETVDYILNFDFVNGFSETVALSASGQPNGSNISFSSSTINSDGNITMTISNFDEKAVQEYTIEVKANSNSVSQTLKLNFKLISSEFNELTLLSPTNNAIDLDLTQELNWNIDINATSYVVEIASDLDFLNIVASSTVITNSFTPSNLIGLTKYFWRVKPLNKCGEGIFSNVYSFTTKEAFYCASTFTDDADGAEHILNVTFGSINNDSGNDTVDGYQDFTSINTNVLRGETELISVTFDAVDFQDHCYVFIDWNQDFVFNKTTERYDLGTRTGNISTASRTIEIPENARIGKTRMRVVLEYDDPTDGFGGGACNNDHLSEWGETEDYSITVSKKFSVLSISESCPDQNNGIIRIEINSENNTYEATITGASTNLTQAINTNNFDVENLNPGTYSVCIREIESNTTECFEVTIQEATPLSLNITSEKSSNTFNFSINSGTPPFEIFIDDELIGISSQNEFNFDISKEGLLKVKSSKECEGVFEKSIGEILSTNNPAKNFILINNPVKEVIELYLPQNVNNENIQASIFDMTGKLIYRENAKVVLNQLQIPFKNFSKGLYILKLSISNAKPIKILKQ